MSFTPKFLFESVQAGARTNGGLRDGRQRHGYLSGEFAPGGHYHNTVGNGDPDFDGQAKGIEVRFRPNCLALRSIKKEAGTTSTGKSRPKFSADSI